MEKTKTILNTFTANPAHGFPYTFLWVGSEGIQN